MARVAATVAVVTAALPYFSRWLQLCLETAIGLLAFTAVVNGSGVPLAVLASLAVGWGVTAVGPPGLRLAPRAPFDRRGAGCSWATSRLTAVDVGPTPNQEWGVGRFGATVDGAPVDVSVYGRDASDAQLLAKTVRFLFYRDSGPPWP